MMQSIFFNISKNDFVDLKSSTPMSLRGKEHYFAKHFPGYLFKVLPWLWCKHKEFGNSEDLL